MTADVLCDVDEREVVTRKRSPEHSRCDECRPEGRKQCVLCREGESAAALPGGERACDECVNTEPEAQEQCCATERGHLRVLLGGRVLRRALRRERVGVRDEDAVSQLARD